MAIYHFQVRVVQRSRGQSVVSIAASRAAEVLYDERIGVTHRPRRGEPVAHAEIQLPVAAPMRWQDRGVLWNEVEQIERRDDAMLAREVEVSLPRELSCAEAITLARCFGREQFADRGMVVDLTVRWGVAADGEAQPHAHFLLSARRIVGENFGFKERSWNDRGLLRLWRERWATLMNEHLAKAGSSARVDHRSHFERGILLEPQNKVGPSAARRAARGEASERVTEHQEIARRNAMRLQNGYAKTATSE